MKKWQKAAIFFGRVSIGLVFILLSLNKILFFKQSEIFLIRKLEDWQSFTNSSTFFHYFFSLFLNWAPALLLFMIFIELFGGLFLFFGKKKKMAAVFLMAFLIFSSILYHPFWYVDTESQMIFFLKNVAIFGGLLYILVAETNSSMALKPLNIEKKSFK